MFTFDLNYWAVLAAGVAAMIIGSLWYSPVLFAKPWMKFMGFTEHDMEQAKKKGMAMSYAIMFVSELVKAFVLAHFVDYTGALTWVEGLQLGLWIWFGFIATTSLSGYIWNVRPKAKALWLIDNGYMALTLAVQAVILTLWI